MGIEKQGGNYGGGLLHLFDWSAKSRKKLFSSKTGKSKQKKKSEGNLPTTRLRMLDEYGIEAGSRSTKECSDYSCASSLTEDSFYKSKAPNLVARLMGLDNLPTPNFLEPDSIPLPDFQSFRRSHHRSKSLDYFQDFKTEVLPPEYAESVKVTRHKLLPPVKNLNVTDPDVKTNPHPSSSSSSVPLKIRELKEKVRAAKKPSQDNEVASNGVKSKGKSISLALQAKANVQKRVGLNSNSKKAKNESMLTSQQVAAQRSTTLERPFLKKGSNALRQNNQKQNCYVDRKKTDVGKKPRNGEVSFARQRNSSKPVGSSRVSSGKLASESKDERVARKKRSNGKNVDSSSAAEVVSFTFNAPMTRPGSTSKRMVLNSDGVGGPKSSSLGHDLEGRPGYSRYSVDDEHAVSSLYSRDRNQGFVTGQMWQGPPEETSTRLELRFPSPVSVLDQFSISESCSNSTGGMNSCSSIQFHDTLSLYADLSDTASSTSAKTVSRSWLLDYEYVKELLNNIEPMFKDYALGKTKDMIKPRLFRQHENRKTNSRINRRLMFDCVNECLDLRCRTYAFSGYELWAKGLRTVKRKDKLADDVCKEISGWGAMGHFMVDEIVDSDMSGKKGTWLEYNVELFEVGVKIESRVLSVLIDEVVDDILVL